MCNLSNFKSLILSTDINIKPNGFYNYDEEFLKISKEIYVRMPIIDAHTRLIINDQIIRKEEFTKETIKKYFNESLKGLKLNTIITDGYSAYPEIIEEIGAKHHSCTFHIMQRLMIPLQKLLNKRNRSIKSLEKQIGKNYRKNKGIHKQRNKSIRPNTTQIQLQTRMIQTIKPKNIQQRNILTKKTM